YIYIYIQLIMSTLCFSWKDLNNDFKKTLKLTGVPTLLRYGTPQKLVEEECFKPDLVKMMFTED
uniref:Thioredoxin domain-containing protein n=1 Tax=Xiphophorus couchianus TaxID=32473 RepID=A0A3B5LXV4_9TELE